MLFKIITALVFVSTLCACGGGSSEVSTPQVEASPEATEVITELNRLVRIPAGLSPVKANTQVMAAAQKHADYLATNPESLSFQPEIPGSSSFTGVSPDKRIIAAGYQGLAVDVEVISQGNEGLQTVIQILGGIINSPFHGLGLLYFMPDIGVGIATTSDGKKKFLVINLASKVPLTVYLPRGTVSMWPCNGVDNVLGRTTATERPNPISGRDLALDPIGTPIYIMGNSDSKLSLTTFSVVNGSTGESVDIIKVLGQDVVDGLRTNERALLPNKPLATGSPYTVTASGFTDGVPFTKTCKFITSLALK